jgi:hypothetical protein
VEERKDEKMLLSSVRGNSRDLACFGNFEPNKHLPH